MKNLKAILLLFVFIHISNLVSAQVNLIDSIRKSLSLERIETLIDEHKLDVNLPNRFSTPLEIAVYDYDLEMVKMLIRKGADINHITSRVYFQTPLMVAIKEKKLDIANYLLEQGADISIKTYYGEMALSYAVEYKQVEMMKHLIKKGADVNAQMRSGKNILDKNFYNIRHKTDSITDLIFYYLLDNGAILTQNHLHSALRVNHKERIEFILSKGIEPSQESVYHACYSGDVELVRHLVEEYNLDVFYVAENNTTCLHQAFSRSRAYYPDLVKYLLEQGIDVNQADDRQRTVFTTTFDDLSAQKAITIGEILLEYGADINHIENDFDRTALMHAVYEDDLESIRFLLENGADINLQTPEGETAIYEAATQDRATLLLLLKNGANPNVQTSYGTTPLMEAVSDDKKKNVKLLLEYGANINEADKRNKTALDWCRYCNSKVYLQWQGAKSGKDLNLPKPQKDTLYEKMFVYNNILWVLVSFGDLYAFDLTTQKLLPNYSIKGQDINAITPYIDNQIAFSTSTKTIKTWDYLTQKLTRLDTFANNIHFLDLQFNSKKELYAITYNGIINLNTKQLFFVPDSLKKNVFGYYNTFYGLSTTFLDSKDNLWIGMDRGEFGGGVLVFNTVQQRFERIQVEAYQYIDYVFNFQSFYEDDSGFVYSTAGLSHMSSVDGQIFKFNQQFEGEEVYYGHNYDTILPKVIYIGVGQFNTFSKQHYIYTPRGFSIKSDTLKNNDWTWNFYYRPEVTWTWGRPNAVGYAINVRDIKFLDEKRMLFLSTKDGVGLYDNENLFFFKL